MYKIIKDFSGNPVVCLHINTNTSFRLDGDGTNPDYQAYLKWLDEGNTPEPADE